MFMTPNIFKNFVTKRATRNHPFVVRDAFALSRGELVNDIEACIFCGMCQRKCPSQCITVVKAEGKWECDPFACVYCGICVDSCPVHCLSQKPLYRPPSPERQFIAMQGQPPSPRKKPKPEAKAIPPKETPTESSPQAAGKTAKEAPKSIKPAVEPHKA